MDETLQNNLKTIAANQTAIYNKGVSDGEQKVIDLAIDDTLSNEGLAADAKATGDAIHNLAIKNKASGSLLTLPDSAEQPFKSMKVFGKTKQVSTTGKNLLDTSLWKNETTNSGLTIRYIPEEDCIQINGTSTKQTSLFMMAVNIPLVVGTTYSLKSKVVSGAVSGVDGTNYALLYLGTKNQSTDALQNWISVSVRNSSAQTKEASQEYVANAWLYVSADVTFNNLKVRLQFQKGSPSEYEPYTGGMPSPNPNYPQALESVGDSGSVEQVVKNGNLLSYPYQEGSISSRLGVTITVNDDGSVLLNGTSTASQVMNFYFHFTNKFTLPAGKYICGGVASSTCYIVVYDPTISDYRTTKSQETVSLNLTEETQISILIQWSANAVLNNVFVKPFIVEASMYDGNWEPYNSQSLTIPTPNGLPGVPVSSGGNYTDENGQQWICDYKDYERMVYVQRTYKYVCTGDEDWKFNAAMSSTYNRYDAAVSNIPMPVGNTTSATKCMCTHSVSLGTTTTNRQNCWVVNSITKVGLRMVCSISTAEDFKQMLKDNYASGTPVTFVYELAEPIETPLSEEEIEAYKALHTNYPVTTIYNNDGAGTEVEYVADTKNYIDNKIATEVAKLTAAIITE